MLRDSIIKESTSRTILILKLTKKPSSASIKREYQSNHIDSQTEEQTTERMNKLGKYISTIREQETAEIQTSRSQDRVKLYTKSFKSILELNFARSQSDCEVSDNLATEYSFSSMISTCSLRRKIMGV